MSMSRIIVAAFVLVLASGLTGRSLAADAAGEKDASAIIDKAVKAAGGQEKLAAMKAATWTTKGTITFGGNENEITGHVTVQGTDHLRQEFEGGFGKGVLVVAGDKAWRKFGDEPMPLDEQGVASERRNLYLQLVAINPLLLKEKGFKAEPAGEQKVGDKPAVGLKVTAPDGKDFTLFFDKESGLPVKLVATVRTFQGDEVQQETTYANYKDFGGIKKATKVEAKRGGEKFMEQEVTDFKVIDKADAEAFTEPK